MSVPFLKKAEPAAPKKSKPSDWIFRSGSRTIYVKPSEEVVEKKAKRVPVQVIVEDRSSLKVKTVSKKVTYIHTPLMLPQRSKWLEMLFFPMPVISSKAAYYGIWVIPFLFAGALGVVLPWLMWGK